MALTTAMYTSLSGLTENSLSISITGNNIANANTTAYKASRVSFETQITQNLQSASAPSGELGGTNGQQLGLGVRASSITRDEKAGSIEPTGSNTDLAIEGQGYFIVEREGEQLFSRAGNFTIDEQFELVAPGGGRVQGYAVDEDYNLVQGVLSPLSIPVGRLTLAEATDNVQFSGNLNAGGEVGTQGSLLTTDTLYSDAAATTQADGLTALDSLYDAGGNQLFTTGDVITLSGVTRGGSFVPDKTFEVGPANTTESDAFGTTVDEVLSFFEQALGIDTSVSGGASIAGGQIQIEGNAGTVNDLEMEGASLTVNAGSATPSNPLEWTKAQDANGESVRTSFVAFDSLGNALNVDMAVVLEETGAAGTNWRFYAQSPSDSDLSSVVGGGTLSFGTDGGFIGATDTEVTIDRDGTGALSPQAVTLEFNQPEGSISALTDGTSRLSATNQNGAGIGTLEDFSIGEDGMIMGSFSNGLGRRLGRVAMATFANPQGLTETSGNFFRPSPNSGLANIVNPGEGNAGRLINGALEMSNVDISREFINLISASTGFSASSRVLTSSDRLIQELINTVR